MVGLIPARAGSKRLKNKNLRPFAGKSLLELTIAAAMAANSLDEVSVSTDSAVYLDVAMNAGLAEAYKRPAELAQDDTNSIEVALDYISWRRREGKAVASHLVLLQPTSPFRSARDIDAAVSAWRRSGKSSLVSAYRTGPTGRHLLFRSSPKGRLSRPDLSKGTEMLALDGAIYITPIEMLETERCFWDSESEVFITEYPRPFDIDDEVDFRAAEALYAAKI